MVEADAGSESSDAALGDPLYARLAQGFTSTTSFQRAPFFGTLCATAVASVLLIAPSAWHRLHFRQKDKEHVLLVSNSLSIAGLAFLAAAMVGAVILFSWFWAAQPLTSRGETES